VRSVGWSDGEQPGSNLHQWESQWASIDEDADGDPDAALSQYADLVERTPKIPCRRLIPLPPM